MKSNPVETEGEYSFAAFVEKVQLKPAEFTQGGNGVTVINEKNKPMVCLENEKPEFPEPSGIKDHLREGGPREEDHSLESFLKKAEEKPAESKGDVSPDEQDPAFMTSFLIELVHTIKSSLASIYHGELPTWEKGDDPWKKTEAHTKVKEEIKRIDTVLNSLLNFISINTPIAKANTLSVILEDILEAIEKQLRAKDIRIARRCEKDLPETFLHSEQVRFVLHSILQYAVFLTPAHESIRILMKSPDIAESPDTRKVLPESKGYVEVMIGFNGGRKPGGPSENLKDVPGDPREAIDLILVLAKEILQKNHGMMTMGTNGSRPKTLITVRFPIERRKVVYYAPITL
jgi:hypothetical protein